MKRWTWKSKMDEMQSLDYQGWHFLCSGEQLPSGLFQAVVRHKASPDDQIRTLVLDSGQHETSNQAMEWAKELAMKWAHRKAKVGHGKV